ncbi:hypothetical protein [Cystobacter fuscus]|uniref:hypothetical protein n=1 Tax=Cystobacter fuscus TaxID=43 RepID=UPI0037BF470A
MRLRACSYRIPGSRAKDSFRNHIPNESSDIRSWVSILLHLGSIDFDEYLGRKNS